MFASSQLRLENTNCAAQGSAGGCRRAHAADTTKRIEQEGTEANSTPARKTTHWHLMALRLAVVPSRMNKREQSEPKVRLTWAEYLLDAANGGAVLQHQHTALGEGAAAHLRLHRREWGEWQAGVGVGELPQGLSMRLPCQPSTQSAAG